MPDPLVSLALIGCGAVAEHVHLPAAAGLEGLEISALVDRDLRRAEVLAERFGVPRALADTAQLDPPPDAALLALPHHLHAAVGIGLLRRGIHVLVEKPMALSTAECDEMIRVARRHRVWLAVGLARRFLPEVRRAKAVIEAGVLGEVEGFEARDGRVFDWPVASDFLFRRELAGGGVLADLGVHALDTLLHLLGELEVVDYADDSYGGVEAEAELRLVLASGAEGAVELSRTRDLGCSCRIQGRAASLELDLRAGTLQLRAGSSVIELETGSPGNFFRDQLADWAEAVRGGRPPAVPGSEGRRSVALVEACYARRRALEHPWIVPGPSPPPTLRGRRVLVTGGTGFLGGRMVEKLTLEQGARVRVLVRDFARAVRIARFDPEMVAGDVTDPRAVERAVEGCDVVFHLAHGTRGQFEQRRAVNEEGTEAVAQAALRAGVSRLVYTSTISLSAKTPAGDVDETFEDPDPEPFSASKLRAEARLLALHRERSLPVAVLRPSCIYGPSSFGFTVDPLAELRSRRVVLVDGGEGLCNLVYVDDVVDAHVLAAVEPAAVGEVFLISGESPVTWKELFAAYERMLGVERTLAMSVEEIRARRREAADAERRAAAVLRRLESRGIAAARAEEPRPYRLPDDHMQSFYTVRPHFRIEKAKRVLGYRPRFDFDRGMRLTELWARWSGLLS